MKNPETETPRVRPAIPAEHWPILAKVGRLLLEYALAEQAKKKEEEEKSLASDQEEKQQTNEG